MELADFFAIDRLSQHDEELLIESAMQMQQMMLLYESGIREIKTKLDILSDESRISGKPSPIEFDQKPHQKPAQHYQQAQAARIPDHAAVHDRQSERYWRYPRDLSVYRGYLHSSGHAHAAG